MRDGRLVLSVTEAAEVLGISRTFAYELARGGQLPVLHLGRRLLVPRAALVSWLGTIGPTAAGEGKEVPR